MKTMYVTCNKNRYNSWEYLDEEKNEYPYSPTEIARYQEDVFAAIGDLTSKIEVLESDLAKAKKYIAILESQI